uniref:Uncharacterized protein n=1 Tax=Rhizophagus irregularis (strain DAOM 181602 / DAOM 197198 / MUCL 43194) TaxID=747089 RepID=U9UT01_RHIID
MFTIQQQISSMAYMDDTQWISESKDNLEAILEVADDFLISLIFKLIRIRKLQQLLWLSSSLYLIPFQNLHSIFNPHNFKGVSINNPSFANNNTVWTVFWIDKFNKSFAGKNIHKDAKNKKIYVQHYQVDQRVDIAYLSLCNGCALNNHQSGDCKFIVPNRDLVLIPIQSYVAHRISLKQRVTLKIFINKHNFYIISETILKNLVP